MSKFNEIFEVEGYWWFPDNPDKKIPGILRYSPDEITLSLVGALTDYNKFNEQFEYDIIAGFSKNGKPVTIHKCYNQNFTMNAPGITTSTYTALCVFIGFQFSKPTDIRFSEIYANLTYLDEWLGISGFKTDVDKLKSNILSITYTQPTEITFDLNEEISLSFWFGYSISTKNIGEKEQKISQSVSLVIKSKKEEIHFDEFRKILSYVKKFVSLATLQAVHPLNVSGKTEANKMMQGDQTITNPISIYFAIADMPTEIKEVHSMKMLFRYSDISDKVGFYFKKWFENKSILEPIYDLYFEVLYNKHLSIDVEFLLLAHAIESYHRRTSNETELNPKEFEERIELILKVVPEQYHDWLKEELRYNNELSLRKRLQSLLKQFPFVLDEKTMDERQFIQFIVETRNYLTHYSNKSYNPLQDINKFHDVCERMKLLVEACLLYQLGFDIGKIQVLLNKSKQIKGLIKPQ